jgi:hypothetical protein
VRSVEHKAPRYVVFLKNLYYDRTDEYFGQHPSLCLLKTMFRIFYLFASSRGKKNENFIGFGLPEKPVFVTRFIKLNVSS